MNITTFLNSRGIYGYEGHSQQVQEQVKDLINLTNKENINIMEIGFNGGHSAEIFLENNKNLSLTSFDLGVYDSVNVAKEYIDMKYPNRHTLILGDSTITIPEFIEKNKNTKFDFIFIDGGHTYEVAKADLDNCLQLAHAETIVAIDDTIYTRGWEQEYTIGPTKTWIEHIQENKIIEIERKEYCFGRGMSWGKYVVKS